MIAIWTSMVLAMAQTVAPGVLAPPAAAGATAPVPATRARAFLPGYFSTDDYPATARRNGESGTVSFSLAIDRDGRVTRCTVTKSSGSTSLDATTCAIIQRRARFTPARDERGKAVEDFTTARIRWDLPAPPPLPVADQYQRLVFTFDKSGKVQSCRIERAPVKPVPSGLCPTMANLGALIAAERASRGASEASEAVIESGLLVGDAGAARRLGTGPGEKRLHLDAAAFDIDASGKVIRCTAGQGTSRPDIIAAGCARKVQPSFVPLASNARVRGARQVIFYQVRYTRPAR